MSGCRSTPNNTPVTISGEWQIVTVTQAQHQNAPVIATQLDQLAAVWVGSDGGGVYQSGRYIFDGSRMERIRRLPLPPIIPRDQQLVSAADDNLHLLWLDLDEDTTTPRLFSALLSTKLTTLRGPTPISDRLTLRFTQVGSADGSVRLIWSGDTLAEPSLYMQRLDPVSRPGQPQRIVSGADYPALVHTADGEVHIFWLDAADNTLHLAEWRENALSGVRVLTNGPRLRPGDRLDNFVSAADDTLLYVFWNITRADNARETWVASGTANASEWDQPIRFGIDTQRTGDIEVPYGDESAQVAQTGSAPVTLVIPAVGPTEPLTLAGIVDNQMVLIYLQAGSIVGYEAVTPVNGLLTPPAIHIDVSQRLYLAWSEPTDRDSANLRLATQNP